MLNRKEIFNNGMMREVVLLFIAIAFIGLSQGFSENIWTNFYQLIGMGTDQRTLLEPIRELPGFLMVFIIAVLSIMTIGRMGTTAMLIRGGGLLCVALFTKQFNPAFMVYIVVVSLGDHIFMPLRNSIGITVANPGYEGRVIGLMDATTTILFTAASLPILFVFNGKDLGDYKVMFILAACMAICAGIALSLMRTRRVGVSVTKPKIVFKKKFSLYYVISFISGLRKQIYMVFAPWLLVKTFSQPVETMTILSIVGAVTVFFFNPFMGRLIDKYGERKLLVGGGLVCTVVYIAYALLCTHSASDSVVVFVLLALNYIDRLTQSTLMGRDIFVKHTASTPDEIMPTLSMGVSFDHISSFIGPLAGGFLWTHVGQQWVFAAGAVIGLIFTAVCFLVPAKKQTAAPTDAPAAEA